MLENLQKITPPGWDPREFARAFLDRFMDDDDRIIGVGFGPTAIDVEIVDATVADDLPAAFHGVPVVLHQPFRREGDSRGRPGPLANL